VGAGASRGVRVSEHDALLELAERAARHAGGLLLDGAAGVAALAVTSKTSPTDLVSEADVQAERAVRELLGAERPDDGFLGEEGGDEQGSSGLRWVVDPLDGTVNYLFGIPQWSVSVAVQDARRTLAGVVYDPNRDELFSAACDGSATLRGPRSASTLQGRAGEASAGEGGLARAMVATGLAYDAEVRAAQGQVLARLAPRVRDIRRLGSAALDLCWTAAGRYDAYFERTVKPWDIAAGALICQRAGLVVLDLPELPRLPWGVLVARSELAEQLVGIVGAD